jgi:hypothetical protein
MLFSLRLGIRCVFHVFACTDCTVLRLHTGHSVTALARKLKGVLSPSAEPGSPQQEVSGHPAQN